MKKILNIFLLLGVVLFMTSCEETLEEINIDPDNPTAVDLNLQLPSAIVQSVFNEGTNPSRVAGIIMQQFVGLEAQQLDYNNYIIGADAMDNYWSTGLYAGVLRSCNTMILQAEEEGRPFYAAVGKIIMANEYGKAASFFGDIPFSEALQGTAVLMPVYDSQEAVYAGVQQLLSDAARDLEAMTDDGGYFGGDLIYDGEVAKWAKVAHAFKARYYMHTAARNSGDYANALSEADLAFENNGDAPTVTFEDSQTGNWSLTKFAIERPATLGINSNFAAMMEGDPRRDSYMVGDDESGYSFFDQASGGNMVWAQNNSTIPMISYVELLFIKAEATARANGSASAELADAIAASFELVGVADDGYIAANSGTGDVQQIVEEAYKAYYGFNFHETWSNWRRTGFPALSPTISGGTGLNPSGSIPQRFLYPDTEQQTNNANWQAAVSRQNGALLDEPVWVFE